METRHSEEKRTSATLGRLEGGGMIKQPKNMTQLKKSAEAAVGSNPIASFFGSKAPKIMVGRPKTKKGIVAV